MRKHAPDVNLCRRFCKYRTISGELNNVKKNSRCGFSTSSSECPRPVDVGWNNRNLTLREIELLPRECIQLRWKWNYLKDPRIPWDVSHMRISVLTFQMVFKPFKNVMPEGRGGTGWGGTLNVRARPTWEILGNFEHGYAINVGPRIGKFEQC